MKLNYYARLAYARTISGAVNLHLVESKSVKTPCTDGKTLWVPHYDIAWDENSPEEIKWWGALVHETYHNDREKGHHLSFGILKKRVEEWQKEGKKPTQLWKAANNCLEDLRIEKREYGCYPGQDAIMSKLRENMMRGTREQIKKGPNSKLDPIFMMQYLGFSKFNRGCLGENVESWICTPELQALWDKVSDLMPYVYDIDHVQEPFDLADEIVRRLTEDDSDEGGEDNGQTEPDKSGEEGVTGNKEDVKEGEEGEAVSGEGDEERDNGDEERTAKHIIHDHSVPLDTSKLPKSSEASWEYRRSPWSGTYPGIPMKEIRSATLTKYGSADLILRHVKTQGLASAIKRELLVMSATRYVGGHKKGKLDGGALWKGKVYRNTDAGKRVFKAKDEQLSLDCAVTLLVDQSGSMAGSKAYYASAAACALNEVFDKIGIKCRIASFTDTLDTTLNYLHKDFTEKVGTPALAYRMMQALSDTMAGNADGENILWEYGKLVVRPEAKKVFIVLSDGMPSDSKGRYDVTTFTKEVTTQIERERKVRLIGIGIVDGSVEYFYQNNEVINNADHIEEVLLRVLKKEIVR